ncbi:TPA: hypothetical protein MM329_000693 [Escherichia coli]|nr:hypothetical protein [Escherichia coli]HBZ8229059.1 hypothetical protein [Escherichia coli]HBZ8345787.1 hypothetical protein [Escherichia coli]HBZ8350856.1 hypothetical protein [Escherichia coli]HBZ8356188.1 hypothetical protein [Escherichia coli]
MAKFIPNKFEIESRLDAGETFQQIAESKQMNKATLYNACKKRNIRTQPIKKG